MSSPTTVDFIARGDLPDQWQMVLVEEGPWPGPLNEELRRIQERLYGCIDAALDGLLAEKFPDSYGKEIEIRLDCYDLPKVEISEFFERFSEGVFCIEDYRKALSQSKFVAAISFRINFHPPS